MIRSRLAVILAERKIANQYPFTCNDIAKETGLHRTTIANLADNQTKRFDGPVLDALCRVLNVQPGELLEYVKEE